MLNSDGLPQTRQLSCGLSLTTSHSAHRTAFCRATAFRGRRTTGRSFAYCSFITEPRTTLAKIVTTFVAPPESFRTQLARKHVCFLAFLGWPSTARQLVSVPCGQVRVIRFLFAKTSIDEKGAQWDASLDALLMSGYYRAGKQHLRLPQQYHGAS